MRLNFLKKFLQYRIITDIHNPNSGPLMTRFFLIRRIFGCSLMIHCFHRSDNDKCFHDHPFDMITFRLSPYIEHTPDGIFIRERFSIMRIPAEWKHWVEVHKDTWTIVFHFPRKRDWGFFTKTGWKVWHSLSEDDCA